MFTVRGVKCLHSDSYSAGSIQLQHMAIQLPVAANGDTCTSNAFER